MLKAVHHTREDNHVTKKKKLAQEQESYTAGFLTFCHHYFVVHPGANAKTLVRKWKSEDEEFPKTQVGDWFNTWRSNFRNRVMVQPSSLKTVILVNC